MPITRKRAVFAAVFTSMLEARARAEVRVHFLYDEISSYHLPRRYIRELRAAGVEVRPFHSTQGSGNRFQLNFRNHRKIIVADGQHGWVPDRDFGRDMAAMFEADFARSRKMNLVELHALPWWFRAASRAAHLTAPVL
jgi:phosphatidylserine/phosphatidylglycerophosphate/cardiolipin synthase-like enzyme